jgi:hypothetical protein
MNETKEGILASHKSGLHKGQEWQYRPVIPDTQETKVEGS